MAKYGKGPAEPVYIVSGDPADGGGGDTEVVVTALPGAHAEDAPHVSGDQGIQILAVRKDVAAAVAANGDYIPLIVDSTGRLWVQVGALPDVRESWRESLIVDEADNDSDKSFTVPATTEYQILGIWVELVTTATAGDRQLVVQWQDSAGDVIGEVRAGIVQAASLTRNYLFAMGVADQTAFRDTDHLTTALPFLILGAGKILRVYDNNAVAIAADDMNVQVQVASRSVA